jgi:hypothetical protein
MEKLHWKKITVDRVIKMTKNRQNNNGTFYFLCFFVNLFECFFSIFCFPASIRASVDSNDIFFYSFIDFACLAIIMYLFYVLDETIFHIFYRSRQPRLLVVVQFFFQSSASIDSVSVLT